MDAILEISGLSKRFGDVQAVDGLSFSVERGSLFAFLGVNGAGKSTSISMICGQLRPDSGSVRVNAGNGDIRGALGVVFQNSALDGALSAIENLRCRGALYGVTGADFRRRLDWLCDMLGLGPLLKRPVGKLSGGERRKCDIARALIHMPALLILDEPTTGLDPSTRRDIWDALARLRRERGATVMLTTHYMEEAADADHVVIINQGRIAAEGTPLELKNRYSGDFITLYGADPENIGALGLPYTEIPGAVRLEVPDTAAATELITRRPELFRDYEITKGKMDDIFLAVTGRRLTGGDGE